MEIDFYPLIVETLVIFINYLLILLSPYLVLGLLLRISRAIKRKRSNNH